MLTQVQIENFKNIRNQTIDLERFTIFVGYNASGKTSILNAIEFAINTLATRNYHKSIIQEFYSSQSTGDLRINLENNLHESIRVTYKSADIKNVDNCPYFMSGNVKNDEFLPSVSPLVLLNLAPMKLAKPSYFGQTVPVLKPDGEGLASVLAHMKINDAFYEELLSLMKELITNLVSIKFKRAQVDQFWGDEIFFNFTNADNVPARHVSEGTLLLLGYLTVLLGPERPKLLLLDDIEHGLHPRTQKSLVDVLIRLMEKFTDLQILATSHSPYLLDCVKPEQVRMMAIDSEGYSVCKKLTEHPKYEKWKTELGPGEMWSIFGEKWLVNGDAKK